jgi:WD40 repeat protein
MRRWRFCSLWFIFFLSSSGCTGLPFISSFYLTTTTPLPSRTASFPGIFPSGTPAQKETHEPPATLPISPTIPMPADTLIPLAPPPATPLPNQTYNLSPAYALTPAPAPRASISAENASRLSLLARWGNGWVNAVAYAPDNSWLAAATSLGIFVFDTHELRKLLEIDTEQPVRQIAVSPDGQMIAASVGDLSKHSVLLWHMVDGTPLGKLDKEFDDVTGLAFLNGGTLLAVAGRDQGISLWQSGDRKFLATYLSGDVTALAVSSDGNHLAVGTSAGDVAIYKTGDAALEKALQAPPDTLSSLAFTPDGSFLVGGTIVKGYICVWELAGGKMHTIPEDASPFYYGAALHVAVSPDGSRIAAGDSNGMLYLFRLSNGSLLGRWAGHGISAQVSVAFSPRGARLLSGSQDGTLHLWYVSDGSLDQSVSGFHFAQADSFALSKDGKSIVFGIGRTVQLRQMLSGAVSRLMELDEAMNDHPTDSEAIIGQVTGVAFSPDGSMIAAATDTGNVYVWSRLYGWLLKKLKQDCYGFGKVAFSPDGEYLARSAVYQAHSSICVWRTTDWAYMRTFQSDQQPFSFSPDGDQIALAAGKNIELRRISDGELLKSFSKKGSVPWSLALSPDGKYLAAGWMDGSLQVWRVNDSSLLYIVTAHLDAITQLAFSPDGRLLATSGLDQTLRLWQASNGAPLAIFLGRLGQATAFQFSSDGRLLVVHSEDGGVRLLGIRP